MIEQKISTKKYCRRIKVSHRNAASEIDSELTYAEGFEVPVSLEIS